MRTLKVEARSPESAQELMQALAGFFPRMTWDKYDRCVVEVALSENPQETAAVLNALQTYVVSRQNGRLAPVELDGETYLLDTPQGSL